MSIKRLHLTIASGTPVSSHHLLGSHQNWLGPSLAWQLKSKGHRMARLENNLIPFPFACGRENALPDFCCDNCSFSPH